MDVRQSLYQVCLFSVIATVSMLELLWRDYINSPLFEKITRNFVNTMTVPFSCYSTHLNTVSGMKKVIAKDSVVF